MNYSLIKLIFFLIMLPALLSSQDISVTATENEKNKIIYGFVRAGLYGNIDKNDDNPYISSAFSDLSLKIESSNNLNFKAFADLRFRYGTEFLEPVSLLNFREAYIRINGRKWDVTAGQSIIKWGRTDFSNPTSKLNPQNYVSRSPDQEDMDMGNLLMSGKWYPFPQLSFEAVVVPFYRSSVLLIDPLSLPEYIKVNQIDRLLTDKKMFSYGFRAEMNLNNLDMSLSWFDGYDPLPGIALTSFNLDLSVPIPAPSAELAVTPYKIRNLGLDFETALGIFGLRGEGAWSFPYESYEQKEYVPCQEIKWVTGIDWMTGNWRFAVEYSGKTIPDFKASPVEPFIGTEFDPAQLAILMADPGFDISEYVRQQVGAFNRLYNYQLEKSYHSAGLRIEADLAYGKLTPSFFTLYNFTSKDLLIMPELRFKPADGLTITAGGEFYSGKEGSVYELVNEFMNCIKIALRVDF
ncbi:MAG: hypothetical protein JXN62_08385 [Bacteroidales bacterium]|nr:hypothetical protein [Bacteroidales bacterium]